jgi:hypothetical protein
MEECKNSIFDQQCDNGKSQFQIRMVLIIPTNAPSETFWVYHIHAVIFNIYVINVSYCCIHFSTHFVIYRHGRNPYTGLILGWEQLSTIQLVLFLNCHATPVQHLSEMCHVTATNTGEREVIGVSCFHEILRGMINPPHMIYHNIYVFIFFPCKALCDLKDVNVSLRSMVMNC